MRGFLTQNRIFRSPAGKRRKLRTDRFRKADVGNDPLVEEGIRHVFGRAVKILIDNHNVARSVILAQTPDSRHAQNVRDSELLQRIDVRPVIQFMRCNLMMLAVACQKHDFVSVQFAFQQLRLCSSERSLRVSAVPHIEMIDSVKSASADDRKFHNRNSLCVFLKLYTGMRNYQVRI